MIVATIVLLIVSLPVLWVLFVPVEIKIETNKSLYEIGQYGTIKLSFHPGQTQFITMRLLGIPMNISSKKTSESQQKGIKKRERTVKKSLQSWTYLFNGTIKAFRCRRFILDIDLDDVVLGAQLFSMVAFFHQGSFQVNINFEKKYYLNVWFQVRINQICWTLMRFLLTKK